MKKIFYTTITALLCLTCSLATVYAYSYTDIERFLPNNRTLDGDPYLTYGDPAVNIDHEFMEDLIQEEIINFNNLVDSYDNASTPSAGYTWDMKIFHPGETPGVLPPSSGRFPVIIVCKGMGGSSPWAYSYMDWLGEAYAAKGYVVAIPQFMHDSMGEDPPVDTTSFDDIRVSIFALQVSQTLDYLEEKFSASGRLNSDNTTMIGHSVGGWVSIRTACHESRVSRIVLLSAMYDKYYYLNVLDTFDIMRFLSSLPEADKPALHVQHYTQNSTGCPPVAPACDPVPIIDGWTTNVSEDLWLPFLCDGGDCWERTGTSNHYLLYDGPKQDGIRDNPYLTHSGGDTEKGYPEVIRLLDEFFSEFPVDIPSDNNSVALVETRSTPGFAPPVFHLEVDEKACPSTYLLGDKDLQLNTIRRFRDEVLAKRKTGKKLIELYYKNGEGIIAVFDDYSLIKDTAKKALECLVPAINLLLKFKVTILSLR